MPGRRRASIVLPDPGGPVMQQVVMTCSGDLERPPGPRLPAHISQVGTGALLPRGRLGNGRRLGPATQDLDRVPEVAGGDDLDAAAQARLGGALRRDDQRLDISPACGLRHRQRAAHGPQAPVEAELGRGCDAGHALDGRLARHGQDGKGDREIEPGPSLRSCAGARLTVRRVPGNRNSADVMPLRTRWRASWTARSARPTTTKLGTPSTRCASTSTRRAVIPMSQKVSARATT